MGTENGRREEGVLYRRRGTTGGGYRDGRSDDIRDIGLRVRAPSHLSKHFDPGPTLSDEGPKGRQHWGPLVTRTDISLNILQDSDLILLQKRRGPTHPP